jgi:hypothetical protein
MLSLEWKLFLPLVWHSYHYCQAAENQQMVVSHVVASLLGHTGQCRMHRQLLEVTIILIGDQRLLSADVNYYEGGSNHSLARPKPE